MSDRAASEVLSFALVFSIVVISVAVVSISGLNSLQNTRDAEQMNNAERAFDVLGDNMADIHQRGAPSRATEVSLGSSELYTDQNVTVNVTVVDDSGGSTSHVKLVRPIVYSGNQDRELVYEAGAIFRTNRDGGAIVAEPPFMVGSSRSVIPIVKTQSSHVESTGGSTVLLRATEHSTTVDVASGTDPYKVYVNITSPRQGLWNRTLDRTEMTPEETQTGTGMGTDASGDKFVIYSKAGLDESVVVVNGIDIVIER